MCYNWNEYIIPSRDIHVPVYTKISDFEGKAKRVALWDKSGSIDNIIASLIPATWTPNAK